MDVKLLLAKGMKILLHPPALRECVIDSTAHVCSKSELTNVELGRYSYIGNNCFMVNTEIGSFCSIADNVNIGGASHPISRVSSSPVFHEGKNVLNKNFQTFSVEPTKNTIIENDVWIGVGVIIKAGVVIHNGAVIGSGSVVTHDIPSYEIWAGNPAKKIRNRFDDDTSEMLENTQWWNLPDEKIQEISNHFDDVNKFLRK